MELVITGLLRTEDARKLEYEHDMEPSAHRNDIGGNTLTVAHKGGPVFGKAIRACAKL